MFFLLQSVDVHTLSSKYSERSYPCLYIYILYIIHYIYYNVYYMLICVYIICLPVYIFMPCIQTHPMLFDSTPASCYDLDHIHNL